ncbi:ABC transporter permease subunit [Phytohabitans houttuyneae]|uniref:ABC transporter permease n=1 Tax=Phytohabitans houttuyneae TaxID=1076126 RepID=A0A6V8K4I0_9ACTN|nr:ABC transporter permease subunit [Phytohabitans houttuyneae]GFJ77301.1 ABC transporter permease [Phytohabitans houttuyneae]
MSAVDVTAAPSATAKGAPPFRFLASELGLIARRRRNQAGLAVLAAVPIIIAIAVKVSSPTSSGGEEGAPHFISSITGNGLFVALAALALEIQLFLPIAVAAVAGDAVAGEANVGTLRYLLTVPVHRTRLLAVKYAGIVVGAFVATVTVAGTGVLAGLLLFGGGDVVLLSGTTIGMGEGLLRVLAICLYLTACLSALGAVGLFVSTLTEQPMGATIAIVMFTMVSWILGVIPQVDWLHPYLLTHWWNNFGDLLRDPVAWDPLRNGLLSAAIYALIFLSAAWARFGTRDVTS